MPLRIQIVRELRALGREVRTLLRILLAGACAATVGCDGTYLPLSGPENSIGERLVVGNAAAALNSDGRYVLPDAVVNPPGVLSEAAARALAVQYIRIFGQYHAPRWVREHGAPIDLTSLRPCDRAYYAQSAYIIPAEAPDEVKRPFGNRWLVALCSSGGRPQVTLSIAPTAVGLDLENPSREGATLASADFFHEGVPLSLNRQVPMSPEFATSRAVGGAGKRVAEIPVLIRQHHPRSEVISNWQVQLEGDVPLAARDGRALGSKRELFVGFGTKLAEDGILVKDPTGEMQPAVNVTIDGRTWVLQPRDPQQLVMTTLGGGQ